MGRLPRELEEKRQRLVRAARRGAFESYVRHGHVPDVYSRIAEMASEAKRLNTDTSLDVLAANRPTGRPTTHYVWRTAGDAKVRRSHVARNGQIFSWANPPEHGHPGHEPNCRCWPEPYYGDPGVPDALLLLVPERRVNTNPGVLWASIDTLTRPDGSLAASEIVMNDGARVRSSFAGTVVNHDVALRNRQSIRLVRRNGTQSIFVNGSGLPLVETTLRGVPRIHVAQLRWMQLPQLPIPPANPRPVEIPPVGRPREPLDALDQSLMRRPEVVLAAGLIALFNLISDQLPSFGAGTGDVPIIAFRAWTNGGRRVAGAVAVTTLAAAEINQLCARLPDVQAIVNAAAAELAPLRSTMNAAKWGTLVHSLAKKMIDARRVAEPEVWGNVFAEISLDLSDVAEGEDNIVRYGKEGSTRLDVLEIVNAELACVYDAKTGKRGLSASRVAQIAAVVEKFAPGALFVIMEILAGEDLPF